MYTTFRPPGGEELRLYIARPAAPGPAVLVLHAWWGLVDDFTSVCDRLAEAGYFAVAPDLNGGQIAQTVAEAERLVEETPYGARVQNVNDTVRWVQAQPDALPGRIGFLGFSLGGAIALRTAAKGVGDAIVTFYGTSSLDPGAAITAPVLANMAEVDPYEPADEANAFFEQLKRQGTPVTVRTWPGTEHWFFERSRSAYQPEAAEGAWQLTLEFLDQHLRQSRQG